MICSFSQVAEKQHFCRLNHAVWPKHPEAEFVGTAFLKVLRGKENQRFAFTLVCERFCVYRFTSLLLYEGFK